MTPISRKTKVFFLCCLLLLAAGGWLFLQRDSGPPTPLTLRLGLARQPDSALALIALEKGFFAAEGLQVELHNYPNCIGAMSEGLNAGVVDVISSSDIPMAHAAIHRRPFRILCKMADSTDINRIVARGDRDIATLADLKNKVIAIQQDSASHYFLHLLLRSLNLTDQELHIRFLPTEDLPHALSEGTIDAFAMREPIVTRAVAQLGATAVILSAPGLYHQAGLLVADAAWLQQSPQAAERLLRALLRAENFVREQPEAATAMLATQLAVSPETIGQIIQPYRLQLTLPQSLVVALEQQADWLLQGHPEYQGPPPNFLDSIAPRPLERIKPSAVTYIH
ncbi:MAG: hypothetical protein BWK76_06440 [Desulfobulbaceae bacterium A2]|nr:MAG: hypothetical protein BWK76_06440 [Desulfobulbaceae bacterium A2]